MPASPVHPIVIWFGRVGDMILLSALLDALQRRYGGRCHVIGAGSWPAQIYATHPAVGRVTCLHRYTAFLFDPAWWRALRALRVSRADPIYVCEYDPRKLARIRRLLRFSGTDAARCLLITGGAGAAAHRGDTQAALAGSPPQASNVGAAHWVDRLMSFARLTPAAFNAADYPWPSPPPRGAPYLEVIAAARARCEAWLDARGWSTRPLVLVQPGNRRTMRGRRLRLSLEDDKAWPLERWAALLQQIHARMPQAVIVLCGAPRESLLLSWISAAAALPAVATVAWPLPTLFALCTRAHSMISVDTGPAHAAAALSLPLVVLFGAHSQAQWLPRSPSGSAVVGLGGPPHSNRLDQIAVQTVFAAWCSLPARAAAPGASVTAPDGALKPTAANATVR
jgi:ADP-heptose:LPS heptosyltransferase